MNKIIFSEGRRDTEFLKELVHDYANRLSVDRLDIPSGPSDTRNPRETNKIRQFSERWDPHDILLKSEGGLPNLLETLPVMFIQNYDSEIDLDVLLDLDGGKMSEVVDELNNRLEGRSQSGSVHIEPCSKLSNRHFISTQRFSIVVNGHQKKEFSIAAFRESLEIVADINKSEDSENIMNQKARDIVDDERVREPIVREIF